MFQIFVIVFKKDVELFLGKTVSMILDSSCNFETCRVNSNNMLELGKDYSFF